MLSQDEIAAFHAAIAPVAVGRGGYAKDDRFRDFRQLFFGTEQGRRVFSQIIALCEGRMPTEAEIASHALLASRAGMRMVGQQIAAWATVEPATTEKETR